MIDWLRKEVSDPSVLIDGRSVPISIRRHARARRLTMRLAPDGSEVRITMPNWGRTRDALVFAEMRREWIARQLAAVPQAEPVGPGGHFPYRGEPLAIAWDAKARRSPRLDGGKLVVGGPEDTLPARIRRWLQGEAVRLLEDDLAFYCARAGRTAPELRLSNAQRRWGSCSSDGRTARCIRINWRLVQAPDHVRRSVVAHEVAHLTHFDHSPAFHALLADLFDGDVREADLWLRRDGRSLYAAFG